MSHKAMTATALFFGSFNPIHKGHTAVARAVLDKGLCDVLWFVVSPLNPLKDKSLVIDRSHRLAMVRTAVEGIDKIAVCDIEFSMPEPSYTIDTLKLLSERYPGREFAVVVGSDSMAGFDRWKNYGEILEKYSIIVYPRSGCEIPPEFKNRVTELYGVPMVDVSSTEIRDALLACADTEVMLDESVKRYIVDNNLWGAAYCRVERLSRLIQENPDDASLYMERGVEYQKKGEGQQALNDFLRVLKLEPDNRQAAERAKILREIFEFAYRDIYNP